MKSCIRHQQITLLMLALLILSGCITSPTDNRTSGPVIPVASPSPASIAPDVSTTQLTLPVLDALLNDQEFVASLKSQLALSEDQIARLKSLASAEVERLRKTNAENSEEESTLVRSEAVRKVSDVIGQEKTKQLSALINEHWAKSGDQGEGTQNTAMSDKPSAVPTDTRVVVNIPAYRMDLFDEGRLIKSYKIGIGYPEFPLPQGLRKAQSIIINPTWTPPDSPWVDNSKVTPGEAIEPGSKLNPLGPVKIPIGMPSLIHGGKAVAKLGSFASHGCVGLTNAQVKDFATRLAEASDTQVSSSLLDSYYKEKTRTRVVKLNAAVPVELRYQTITVENGSVHIYKDVYAEHTNTKEKLDELLSAFNVKFDELSEAEKTQLTDAMRLMSPGAPPPAQTPSPDPGTKKSAKNSKEKTDRKSRNNKEIVVSLSALAKQGYPEPVDLDTGNGSTKLAVATKPSEKK